MNAIVRQLYKLLDNRFSDDTVVLSIEEVHEIVTEIERLDDLLDSLESTVNEWASSGRPVVNQEVDRAL